MGRSKKQARSETISGGYSAIPWTVLDSVSFIGASDKAKALLFALMRQHNGNNNGRLQLSKTWLAKHGYTCPASNIKARNELLERGLIIQTKHGGLNMGADQFALSWHDISNFVGLDISSRAYQRGLYTLCNLAPAKRRKQPIKKSKRFTQCNCAGSLSENNVITPLPTVNTRNRIVGVKGKSGIAKHSANLKKLTDLDENAASQ